MELEGRVAIVSGAARGIGRAIALKLAADGATVAVNDVGEPGAVASVVKEIEAAGGRAVPAMADVSVSAEVDAMVNGVRDEFGKIDILVNNAGIARDRLLIRMTDEEWEQVMRVNLTSVFNCTRAVLRHMSRARFGRIVSVASVSGLVGNPGQANYAASKAGIIGFTRTVAREMAARGITANVVAPGLIDTGLAQALSDEQRQDLKRHIPLGSLGQPEDIAAAVLDIIRDDALVGEAVEVGNDRRRTPRL